PGARRLVVDVDSTVCEVCGEHKQGAAFGYTHVRGYHPILATRSDTGEVLHARMRKGSANTSRGARRFIEELVPRLRRAGATGEIVLRMDSGFWSNDTLRLLGRLKVRFTMAVRCGNEAIRKVIAAIDEEAWVGIDYTEDGIAQVAETSYKGRRLVVRRTRLVGPEQKLWPDWRHFAFLTDLEGTAVELDSFHRDHARIELAIRDLKEGAGMEHVPSGQFFANAAWLCCAVLAHDLLRWTAILGGVVKDGTLVVARTVRCRMLSVPARLVNRSGAPTLRAPEHWPWAAEFNRALSALRSVRVASG
ncbi:MAG: IS1380 family transposase, partial [Acidimicrobiales bacterium]